MEIKRILILMTLIWSGIIQAQEVIKEIKTYDQLRLVRLEVSNMKDIRARLINEKINHSGYSYTKLALELEFVVEWPGCGWFDDKNQVLISKDISSKNLLLYTLTEAQGFSCQSGVESKRIFKYKFYPVVNEQFAIANKIKVNINYTPNPKGEEFRSVFKQIEITNPKGEMILLTENEIEN